jgi:hypothetical protein
MPLRFTQQRSVARRGIKQGKRIPCGSNFSVFLINFSEFTSLKMREGSHSLFPERDFDFLG